MVDFGVIRWFEDIIYDIFRWKLIENFQFKKPFSLFFWPPKWWLESGLQPNKWHLVTCCLLLKKNKIKGRWHVIYPLTKKKINGLSIWFCFGPKCLDCFVKDLVIKVNETSKSEFFFLWLFAFFLKIIFGYFFCFFSISLFNDLSFVFIIKFYLSVLNWL